MKKYIITIILAFGLGMGLNAQNDGFFTYSNVEERNNSWGMEPALPLSHGLNGDVSAAPLGSGLLILGALALGYRKLKVEN